MVSDNSNPVVSDSSNLLNVSRLGSEAEQWLAPSYQARDLPAARLDRTGEWLAVPQVSGWRCEPRPCLSGRPFPSRALSFSPGAYLGSGEGGGAQGKCLSEAPMMLPTARNPLSPEALARFMWSAVSSEPVPIRIHNRYTRSMKRAFEGGQTPREPV